MATKQVSISVVQEKLLTDAEQFIDALVGQYRKADDHTEANRCRITADYIGVRRRNLIVKQQGQSPVDPFEFKAYDDLTNYELNALEMEHELFGPCMPKNPAEWEYYFVSPARQTFLNIESTQMPDAPVVGSKDPIVRAIKRLKGACAEKEICVSCGADFCAMRVTPIEVEENCQTDDLYKRRSALEMEIMAHIAELRCQLHPDSIQMPVVLTIMEIITDKCVMQEHLNKTITRREAA